MTVLLCAAACAIPRRHVESCTDEQCRGCLPARAADGLRLCRYHVEAIGKDALLAAVRHADLGLVLATTGQPGERVSGHQAAGMALNERAAEARATIRHTLVAITLYVAETRGFSLPADTVPALARFVARQREWLAADEGADEHSAELHELAHGEAYRIAYPSGTRVVEIAPCPERVDGQPCPGVARAIMRPQDSLFPPEIACDHDETHRWPASQWRRVFGQRERSAA